MFCLTIEVDGRERRHAFVSDQVRVGSAPDNDVAIDSSRVSRHHAVLTIVDGHLEVQDLDSRNGTLLNGARVTFERVKPPAKLAFGPIRASVIHVDTDDFVL